MHDVVVLGHGVVAFAAALACHQKGYDVAIIAKDGLPKKTAANGFDPKVCAINRPSEHLLKHLGVWDELKDKTYYDHVLIWDAHHNEDVLFNAADCAEPNLGHIIAYEAMRQSLAAHVRKAKIKVYHDELKSLHPSTDGHQLITSQHEITTKLVLGADGAQSYLKTILGIESVITDYAQNAIGAVIKHDSPHYHTARQRFMPSGPLALLPLHDLHHSALVWSLDAVKSQRLKSLDVKQFEFELMAHYQGRMGDMRLQSDRMMFPLKSHHAKQYGKPGILLIGDAAHTVHPLAGQGLNLGLMDVAVVVDLLARHGLDSNDLLNAYTQKQRNHNERMRQAMTMCQQMFHVAHPLWVKVRSIGMRLLDGFTPGKRQLSLLALGYQPEMPSMTQPKLYQEAS